jgi:Family of unknown function (DUF6176)
MDTTCVRIRLRPNSADRVRAWAAELNRRRAEVIATLEDEHVSLECAFLERAADADYLIYIVKADDLADATEVGRRSTRPIDVFHRAFKTEVWESSTELEPLVDFDRR